MNKSELVEVVSEKLGDRRTASAAVEAVVDAITRAVARGEKVGISGFGVFERVDRAARTARNPTTGEAVKLKKTTVPKFRPGQGFKDIVSGAKKISATSGDRAVTARAGVPRTSATPAKAPAKSARPAAKAATSPAKAAKATASAAQTSARSAAKVAAKTATPVSRAGAKAPTGRTVAAPGASRSAAAANAPGRASKTAGKAASPAKRTSR